MGVFASDVRHQELQTGEKSAKSEEGEQFSHRLLKSSREIRFPSDTSLSTRDSMKTYASTWMQRDVFLEAGHGECKCSWRDPRVPQTVLSSQRRDSKPKNREATTLQPQKKVFFPSRAAKLMSPYSPSSL